VTSLPKKISVPVPRLGLVFWFLMAATVFCAGSAALSLEWFASIGWTVAALFVYSYAKVSQKLFMAAHIHFAVLDAMGVSVEKVPDAAGTKDGAQ
jgi:hypothetical protein